MKLASCGGVASVAFVLLILAALASAEPLAEPWREDADAAWRTARDSGRPLVVVFSSANCYYCRKMTRDTLSDPRVVADIQSNFVATVVRAADRPQTVRRAGVRAFPTTILIGPDGKIRDRIVGYRSPGPFRERLSSSSGP